MFVASLRFGPKFFPGDVFQNLRKARVQRPGVLFLNEDREQSRHRDDANRKVCDIKDDEMSNTQVDHHCSRRFRSG